MMETITIIGMGWLGTAFAKASLAPGRRVVGTARNIRNREETPEGIALHPFSLGQPLPAALADDPDEKSAVIAISPSSAGMPPARLENSLKMLAGDLAACNTVRIVYVSATSVYPCYIAEAKESDAKDIPSSRSGISMYRLEKAVTNGASETPVTVVRFGGLFGPGREPGRFFSRRPLKHPDDPVNLIHLDDCIGVLNLALRLNTSHVINAVAPLHPEKGLFYTAAALAIGEHPPVSHGSARSATSRIVNVDHLVSDLGYEFIHPNPISLYY